MSEKKNGKIRRWLFMLDKDSDFNTRLFLLGSFVISVSNLLGFLNNIYLGLNLSLLIANAVFGLSAVLLFFWVRKVGYATPVSGVLLILASAVSVMIFWPLNSGFGGPILLYFAILPIFLSLFLNRKKSYLTLLVGLLIVGIFFWYYFLHPNLIVPYQTQFGQYFDNFTSLVFVSWGLLEIGLFYREETEKSNKKLLEHAQLMEIQNKGLKELDEFKTTVFASLSHDIKSPIQNAGSLFELLLDNDISLEDKKRITQMASIQMAETSAYVENVLFWARSQMGGLNVNKIDFQVEKVIQEVVDSLKYQLSSKNILLAQNIPENLVAYGDKGFFFIVISNFIRNAIKYSNQGGRIQVIARPEANKVIKVQVIDEGIGISPERISTLFESAINTKGTNNEKGSGLGLRISKLFSELNGGNVSVISTPGLGSKFETSIREF